MGIKLSEHRNIQLNCSNEIEAWNYLSSTDFNLIQIEERRKLFGKVFPYKIVRTQESYDIEADYYIGLDWLVVGKRYIHVEPKVNKELLKIYQELVEQDEFLENENPNLDKINKARIENGLQDESNLKTVDYLRMLLEVYTSDIPKGQIGNLAEIHWEDAKIKIQQKDDYLTPFLVIQFLGLLKTIVKKGLKKSYYKVQENLTNQVKGKILVGQHIKQNIFKNRLTSTYCEYQVFGENSLENQFLKKVFKFCTHYIQNQPDFFESTKIELNHTINYIRPAFELIDDSIKENQLRNFKHNPFFKEYKEAIKIGSFILKQLGYNISVSSGKEIETPPFWIDMPRLFELYFYQKLLKANPNESSKVVFQLKTYGNALDFLIKDGVNSIVIDTKYKLHYQKSHIHQDIRQVSGYARLKKVREKCKVSDDFNIACLIVYPLLGGDEINFSLEKIKEKLSEENEIKAYHKVYKLGIQLPVL